MDAVKFLEKRGKVCVANIHDCKLCPITKWCGKSLKTQADFAAEFVATVEEWTAAHTYKTRQDLFLEQYPNAKISEKGTLYICPIYVDKNTTIKYSCICSTNCSDCRREFWSQEVE